MRRRFIAVEPSGDIVFNTVTQDCFMPTLSAAKKAILAELEEPQGEDEFRKVQTLGDETGWDLDDYKIYQLVRIKL